MHFLVSSCDTGRDPPCYSIFGSCRPHTSPSPPPLPPSSERYQRFSRPTIHLLSPSGTLKLYLSSFPLSCIFPSYPSRLSVRQKTVARNIRICYIEQSGRRGEGIRAKGILWILSCRAKATKTCRKRVAREFVQAPLGLRHRYVSEEGLEPCQCNDMLL